jgi:hypothetical protein
MQALKAVSLRPKLGGDSLVLSVSEQIKINPHAIFEQSAV